MCFHSIGPQVHTGALTAPPRLNAIHLPAANPAVPTLSENAKTRNRNRHPPPPSPSTFTLPWGKRVEEERGDRVDRSPFRLTHP
eukprot:4219963-Pyramimonas_sp.AAC.1